MHAFRRAFALSALLVASTIAFAQDGGDAPATPEPEPPGKESPKPEGVERIIVLYTNDTHSHYLPHLSVGKRSKAGGEDAPKPVQVGGYAAIAAKAKELRDKGEHVLLLDSGDVMSGHPVADLERQGAKGGALFEMMNAMGYDAWCIGNHDFDHGRANTAKLLELAKFPTVSANLKLEGEPALKIQRWVVLERFGLKIGVFGLMTEGLFKVLGKEKAPGVEVLPTHEAAREAVKALREKGCDLVIGLSHCGSGEDKRLLQEVKGIDLMLSGHDHMAVEPRMVGDTIQTESGNKALRLGRVDLHLKDKKLVSHEGRLMTLPHVAPEGELKKIMDDVHEAVGKALEEKLGKLETAWKRQSDREANIGNFFCDGLLAKAGADVSFLNGGGIRRDVPEGDLTVGDVMEIFPIENTIVTFELTGEQLLKACETNAHASATHAHGALQVGGVRYDWERTGKSEVKVLKATVKGEAVDPKKTYKCVSTDFVAIDQADKYLGTKPGKVEKQEYGMQAVALDHARAAAAKGPIKTELDGRITYVKAKKD
jgi:5'-nucleotidase/UDP-sugar diphosphatase